MVTKKGVEIEGDFYAFDDIINKIDILEFKSLCSFLEEFELTFLLNRITNMLNNNTNNTNNTNQLILKESHIQNIQDRQYHNESLIRDTCL